MDNIKIRYRGRVYQSLKDLYCRFDGIEKVGFSTFYGRIKRGWDVDRAIKATSSNCIKLVYNGVKYKSASSLYTEEKRRIRASRHRRPAIDYTKFLEILKSEGVDAAVFRMHQWHLSKYKNKGLQSRSRELGGADNLVCQRVTKLGWSLGKAMSTPKSTKGLPIKVNYKGNNYRSISECYNAVSPEMSIIKFAKFLRKHNFKIT